MKDSLTWAIAAGTLTSIATGIITGFFALRSSKLNTSVAIRKVELEERQDGVLIWEGIAKEYERQMLAARKERDEAIAARMVAEQELAAVRRGLDAAKGHFSFQSPKSPQASQASQTARPDGIDTGFLEEMT